MKAKIIKYGLLLIAILTVSAGAFYALTWKSTKEPGLEATETKDGQVYGLTAKLPPGISLKQLQDRIYELQEQPTRGVRWFMNIPKDELAAIGPPAETRWATSKKLWDKGMVGLYFITAKDKESPVKKKKRETKENRLLQKLLKDL